MDTAFLGIRQLSFAYDDKSPIIRDIDLHIQAGAFHCLLGRSGCGKSTLLKLAAGLLVPDSGEVLFEGRPVQGPDTAVSFVFQAPALLEWSSVLDNVLLPVRLRHRPRTEDIEQALTLLHELGLEGLENRYPHQLSGGQQSRVAIARTLLTQPRLILMDEPFAALDALTREELQTMLLQVCHDHGTAVCFVSHDIAEAVYLADHISVMDGGRIVFSQEVQLARPRTPGMRHDADFSAICAHLRQVMLEQTEASAVS